MLFLDDCVEEGQFWCQKKTKIEKNMEDDQRTHLNLFNLKKGSTKCNPKQKVYTKPFYSELEGN